MHEKSIHVQLNYLILGQEDHRRRPPLQDPHTRAQRSYQLYESWYYSIELLIVY